MRKAPIPADDEGSAIAITLATILLVAILSTLITGAVVAQVGPAQFAQKNTRTAHGAEAGLDVALGGIRAAFGPDALDPAVDVGYRSLLPCDPGTTAWQASGVVEGQPGAVGYEVRVRYYATDPTGQSDTWRAANAITCTAAGPADLPLFALLESTGTGSDAGQRVADRGERTLVQVYDLRTTNANIPGGLIHRDLSQSTGLPDLCLDSGTAFPASGAVVRMDTCDDTDAGQVFWWRRDFTIVQTSTVNSPGGEMCVTSSTTSGTGATQTITMQPCTVAFPQQWGYTDAGFLQVFPLYPGTGTGYCMLVGGGSPPASLTATNAACGLAIYNPNSGMRPDASVGAGSVGDIGDTVVDGQPYQWVNYDEFGRCFDITGWNVNATAMIAYPCKQNPTSPVGWNQVLQWSSANRQLSVRTGSSGQAYTVTTGQWKCLQAPAPGANPAYVVMRDCQAAGSVQAEQRWTVTRDTGFYPTSYLVLDGYGRCLSLDQTPGGAGHASWSKIIVETCDGSDRQKWNAPPGEAPAAVRDTQELP